MKKKLIKKTWDTSMIYSTISTNLLTCNDFPYCCNFNMKKSFICQRINMCCFVFRQLPEDSWHGPTKLTLIPWILSYYSWKIVWWFFSMAQNRFQLLHILTLLLFQELKLTGSRNSSLSPHDWLDNGDEDSDGSGR